jgi:hypothetical protein
MTADTPNSDNKPQTSPRPRAIGAAEETAQAMSQDGRKISEEMSTRAADVYRDSTEFAAERMRVMLSAYSAIAGGLQEIQKTYVEALQRSMEMAANGPREMMQCKSFSDLASLQRDFLRRGLDEWFESGSKMIGVSSRIAEDAMRPAEDRTHQAAA